MTIGIAVPCAHGRMSGSSGTGVRRPPRLSFIGYRRWDYSHSTGLQQPTNGMHVSVWSPLPSTFTPSETVHFCRLGILQHRKRSSTMRCGQRYTAHSSTGGSWLL